MLTYVVVLLPRPAGEWRAIFPDFKHSQIEAASAELALRQAIRRATTVIDFIRTNGCRVPVPRSLIEIQADTQWCANNSINWATAMTSLVSVGNLRPFWRRGAADGGPSWMDWLRERARRRGTESKAWNFLNSGFGLWFMTTVVVGIGTAWVPVWWQQLRADEENEIQLSRVSREILCRLNGSLSQAQEELTLLPLSRTPNSLDKVDLANELLSSDGEPARVCGLNEGTQSQTLHGVLTEWQRLVPLAATYDFSNYKIDFSEKELLTFSLLSSKEDITQLTADIRRVVTTCVDRARESKVTEAQLRKLLPYCRINEFMTAVKDLLHRVQRPIQEIVSRSNAVTIETGTKH